MKIFALIVFIVMYVLMTRFLNKRVWIVLAAAAVFLVAGVFIHIAVQVILNIAVVSNFIPNTGVTLPFISYGGSSVMILLAEIGIVLSVAKGSGKRFSFKS